MSVQYKNRNSATAEGIIASILMAGAAPDFIGADTRIDEASAGAVRRAGAVGITAVMEAMVAAVIVVAAMEAVDMAVVCMVAALTAVAVIVAADTVVVDTVAVAMVVAVTDTADS